MRKIIRVNLERCGIKNIEEANDGAQAIQKFSSMKHVDLMFLDINMPIKTGKEVVELLGAKNLLKETKTVIISTELSSENKDFFFKYNIYDFIPKPFDLNAFNKVVTPLLQRKDEKTTISSMSKSIEESLNSEELKVEGKDGNIVVATKAISFSVNIKKAIQTGSLEVLESEEKGGGEEREMLPLN